MSKLWLIGLAASAAWIPSAMAHGGPPPNADPLGFSREAMALGYAALYDQLLGAAERREVA